jgi:hypothetical protein
MVLGAETFWAYVEKQWMPKVDMWLTGNRHLLHVGQDTNATIESYHGNMKAVLRALKSRLVGRRVVWLIHELTYDVIMKYKYNQYLKENGFISNKKEKRLVINSVLQSLKIPNSYVSLPTVLGQRALMTSSKWPHVKYAVYNLDTQWACCECIHSQKGNLCKYQIKVLQMMKPELANGTIIKVCGTLYGTRLGGVLALYKPVSLGGLSPRQEGNASEEDFDSADFEYK